MYPAWNQKITHHRYIMMIKWHSCQQRCGAIFNTWHSWITPWVVDIGPLADQSPYAFTVIGHYCQMKVTFFLGHRQGNSFKFGWFRVPHGKSLGIMIVSEIKICKVTTWKVYYVNNAKVWKRILTQISVALVQKLIRSSTYGTHAVHMYVQHQHPS